MMDLTPDAGKFFIFYLIIVFISLNGSSIGLVVGSLISDPAYVPSVTPAVIIPIAFFAGLFKNRGDYNPWMSWIEYLSPIRYSFNGLLINEVGAEDPRLIQQQLFIEAWECILALIGFAIVLRIVSIIVLSLITKKLE